MRISLRLFVGIVITAITLWGVGALYFSPLLLDEWRAIGAGGYALTTILLCLFPPRSLRHVWNGFIFNREHETLNFELFRRLTFADNAEVHLHCVSRFYEQQPRYGDIEIFQ
jgi:hypothetical protein